MISQGIDDGFNNYLVFGGAFILIIMLLFLIYLQVSSKKITEAMFEKAASISVEGKQNFKTPNRYEFPKKNNIVAYSFLYALILSILGFVLSIISPSNFEQLFYYQEVSILFLFGIIISAFGVIFNRNETGYIIYDANNFILNNKFIFGNNLESTWAALEEIKLQRLQNDSANIVLKFKDMPLISLAEKAPSFKHFIAEMAEYLIANSFENRINEEYVTNDITSGLVSSNIKLKNRQILNWLKK